MIHNFIWSNLLLYNHTDDFHNSRCGHTPIFDQVFICSCLRSVGAKYKGYIFSKTF